MKNVCRVAAGGAVLGLALLSPVYAAPAKKVAPAVPQATAPVGDLELVHTLGPDKGAQLQKLVDRFNAANPGTHIVVSERPWTEGALPHMLILGERDLPAFLAGPQRYRPLYQVMKDAGERVETLKAPAFMTPTPLDASNRLLALPVGLSTPVMFYNRDAFKAAGVNPDEPPKTWQDLQGALGKLVANGSTCPYTSAQPAWILVENSSAWHNEPVVAEGKRASLAINGMLPVKHVAMLSSWFKARYLHVFGRGDEATEKFAQGECAVLTAPSAALPTLRREAKFDVGVATLPYHAEYYGAPQNTLADGPALWIGAGKKPAEYKAIARFVNLWLTPESQVEWQRNAGYLPLNRAGLLAATESRVLGPELEAIRIGVKQLTHKPVTKISSASSYPQRTAVRQIVEEELEAVWADRKPSKVAMDDAVARSRSLGCSPSC
ncbi:MAG TPA: extracellular solute-binding protein [Zoogloea sp.]|uniref:extracellular solute-binding protein n=1 Tax=Zoogloea sp. TaxID=49181 RepID=UPI002CEC26AF|nr:extracellular solute-binding protein [Zoogloea sp.]HMV17063.1 extracellular solute-binding protein [Rhodocyclaceae bacterium]HMW52342.1 extracellular solute-binding protein [Rhodocyclaceae bacterium]HNA68562.1 extracellular solute-binding protein [Rhodocyclaceae bacterium]HNB64106.1 extracellular solute-binding protein [Rhodocyclaceae bacterium]HNC79029.1 extracellular solute-binding protein [Rhodocyclaceae bacterium]